VPCAAGAIPLALSACDTGGPPAAGPAAGQPSRAPATITFLGRGSVTNQQSFQELSERFMQQHPHVTVQYTHESGNFDQKYQVLAAGGQTPDVGFSTVANYKSHVARGLAGYLDDLAKGDKAFKEADYDAYWLEALRYKGRLAGLPWDPGMVCLMFNRGLLQKAGVPFPSASTPLTWEATIDLAKRLTVDTGGGGDPWGL
jgi:multiple sugar transport system substrate-binding protein